MPPPRVLATRRQRNARLDWAADPDQIGDRIGKNLLTRLVNASRRPLLVTSRVLTQVLTAVALVLAMATDAGRITSERIQVTRTGWTADSELAMQRCPATAGFSGRPDRSSICPI